jgi:RNA 3'-terminal phosphate cyclase (ATP)
MLVIDGSFGEGGGQILRSALALSMVTGTPFRIEKIRANRDNPGLARQHLTAVTSAAALCSARVEGAELRSTRLTFSPGRVKAGDYIFSVGSAGSTTLVLQTVLPALLVGRETSTLTLEGGTHNPFAPPLDFLEKAFLPIVNRMGPKIDVALEQSGFAPRGGGRVIVTVEPAAKLSRLDLPSRGALHSRHAKALVAGLPRDIARRELSTVKQILGWEPEETEVVELPEAYGPGNVLALEVESEHVTEVFSGVGRRGVPAEAVASEAANAAKRYLAAADVPVGDCLADQLLLPFALAGGGSYKTLALTRHAATNIEVIRMFLDVRVAARDVGHDAAVVEVGPEKTST